MADRLMRGLCRVLLLCVLSTASSAQMADPTRPPGGASAAEAGAEGAPVLQSVIIPKRGKPLAVIGGQQVRLGERHGESRLIKLSEREAVLEGPSGIERLLLTPAVEKKNSIVAKEPTKHLTQDARKTPAFRPAQGEGRL